MRILHVLTRPHRRGAQTFGMGLHDELLEHGLSSRVVALAPASVGSQHFEVPVLGSTPRGPATLRALRRHAREADVVIAHGSDTLLACRLALLGSRVPFVYVNIGDPLHWAASRSRRLRVTWMMRGAAAVAAISPTAVDRLVQYLHVKSERVRFTGNGRRSDHFLPATAAQRTLARKNLRLPDDVPVAVIIAALSPEKRVDIAISALADLPGWRLVVVGAGPLNPALTELAGRSAPGRVVFTGALVDVRPALHAADVALLTSTTEGLPGALIEAAMAGLPVVATDVGFVRDVVSDGGTGRLVPISDVPATAQAARDCLEHAEEWGQQARASVVATFETRLVVERWLDLLHDVTQGRNGR